MSTCLGCRGDFIKPAVASDNLVIQHKSWRGYTAPDGTHRQKYGNVYYHINMQCVTTKEPGFHPSNLVVGADVRTRATAVHNSFLAANLGVSLF